MEKPSRQEKVWQNGAPNLQQNQVKLTERSCLARGNRRLTINFSSYFLALCVLCICVSPSLSTLFGKALTVRFSPDWAFFSSREEMGQSGRSKCHQWVADATVNMGSWVREPQPSVFQHTFRDRCQEAELGPLNGHVSARKYIPR